MRKLSKLSRVMAALLLPALTATVHAQPYVLSHEIIDGYGWFGGDDRPNQGPRHVGIGQSVLIDTDLTVERFAFYFRGPFDFAATPTGAGHAVTLVLDVRDAAGNILKTLEEDVPEPFTADWVQWPGIDLDVDAGTELLFTSYLKGAHDTAPYHASYGADINQGYAGGQLYAKHGSSDADMSLWVDWSLHPSWDAAFRLEGSLRDATNVAVDGAAETPAALALSPNYPNPFRERTILTYEVERPALVTITVYDMMGRRVRTLVDEVQPIGTHQVVWDGRSGGGQPVAAGPYVYRLQVGEVVQTRRMLLVK